MARIDIAEASGAVDEVVPARRSAVPVVGERRAQMHVGDEPRCVAHVGRCIAKYGGRVLDHTCRDEDRQRDDATLGLPAHRRIRRGIECIDLDAGSRFGNARDSMCHFDPVAEWPDHTTREPRIAFGPCQHSVAFSAVVARRMEAVSACKVMDASPGRDVCEASAVVVAAAIVEVPAQMRVTEAFGVEPCREADRIERQHLGRRCDLCHGDGEPRLALQRFDA